MRKLADCRTEYLSIGFVIIFGAFLRLYQLGKQVIGDDEWHAIYIAANKPIKYIISHFHPADNCIPLTVFYRFSLNTIGLNEFMLHFLQIITGIGALILFPIIIKSVFNKKIRTIFVGLLAISPLLVYYSRYARPYGIVTFLGFISIFSFYSWIKSKNLSYAIVYVFTAVLAPYFSLISFVEVAAPLLYVFVWVLIVRIFSHGQYQVFFPQLRHLLIIGVVLGSGIALWFVPTYNSLSSILEKANVGSISINTLKGFLALITGSRSLIASLIIFLCLVAGFYLVYTRNKFLFGIFASVTVLQILTIVMLKPHGLQDAIVFARYSIACLPLWLLLMAVALNEFSLKIGMLLKEKAKIGSFISRLILPAFLFLIFLQGPIINTYFYPNNFTNHNDYQYDYKNSPLKLNKENLNLFPKFYLELKNAKKDIILIETPYIMLWPSNNFHIYQRYHRKRVLIGHTHDSFIAFYIPYMHKKIHLKNFVPTVDKRSLELSKATYVVIHKDLLAESVYLRSHYPAGYEYNQRYLTSVISNTGMEQVHGIPSKKQSQLLISKLMNIFDHPFYEDKWIAVFKIK